MNHSAYPVPVTLLLQDLSLHGAQRQTLELAARLDRSRFTPRLVTLCGGDMPFLPQVKALGLECHTLTDSPLYEPAKALPALWRYLRVTRPPLLLLLTAQPNLWGRIMGKALRLPNIIGSCRNIRGIDTQYERFLKNFADTHICNSQLIHDVLYQTLHIPRKRLFYIPNGVDTEFFAPAQKPVTSQNVLCIARMVPQKNHAVLIDAFARVRAHKPDAVLHLAGEGPLKPTLQKQAGALGLNGQVRFHPGDLDLRPLIHNTQVFTLTSDHEGMPNVVLEAMACGIPVVATNICGSSEVVLHEQTGLLVPRGDADAIAGSLLRLLANDDERLSFGRAGRERALAHYSLKRMVTGHEEAFEFTLNR